MWLKFRVVNTLPFKWHMLSFIFYWRICHSLHTLWTVFHLICCCSIEFRLVSIINIWSRHWSLRTHLKGNITFFVLCLIIERRLFLCVLIFHWVSLRLNFVWLIIMVVGSFQDIGVVMSLLNFVSARLVWLRLDFIRDVVVMSGWFSYKFDVWGWTVMLTWINLKPYHMCIFGMDTFRHNIWKGHCSLNFSWESAF